MERINNKRTFGGRPRFLGGAAGEPGAGPDELVPDFLFLLPLGRPRPRLTGGLAGAAAVSTGRESDIKKIYDS
jgi:hypothetical protein